MILYITKLSNFTLLQMTNRYDIPFSSLSSQLTTLSDAWNTFSLSQRNYTCITLRDVYGLHFCGSTIDCKLNLKIFNGTANCWINKCVSGNEKGLPLAHLLMQKFPASHFITCNSCCCMNFEFHIHIHIHISSVENQPRVLG